MLHTPVSVHSRNATFNGCNTGKVDFYEDSPFHPDRLLKDLIKIFHPTLLEGYELKYFTKLAE